MLFVLLQLLTIHLDESDVFSAWVSSIRDLGINPPSEWEDCKSKISITSFHQKMIYYIWITCISYHVNLWWINFFHLVFKKSWIKNPKSICQMIIFYQLLYIYNLPWTPKKKNPCCHKGDNCKIMQDKWQTCLLHFSKPRSTTFTSPVRALAKVSHVREPR